MAQQDYEKEMDYLQKKIEAGANMVVTQVRSGWGLPTPAHEAQPTHARTCPF